MFEDFEIEIHCPHCDAETAVMLSQIAREEHVACPCCKGDIALRPDPMPDEEETGALKEKLSRINDEISKRQRKP